MNPDVKTAWVANLRSGYFKPGKYQLRDLADNYDPVGVLCEQARCEGVEIELIKYTSEYATTKFRGYTYNGLGTGAPVEVLEWAEIAQYQAWKVSLMRDNGVAFDAIADYIEDNF